VIGRKLGGLYLVVSPILPLQLLISATEKALDGGVDLVQLSVTSDFEDRDFLANELARLAKKRNIPFLVNNSLELAVKTEANGVHFDAYNISPDEARQVLGKDCIVGYTVNVDLEKIQWAEEANADYVSFCSIFHPCSQGQCPIVSLDTLKNAAGKASISVFAAGGINLGNLLPVLNAGVDGVVVTSAILKSENPLQSAKSFKEIINKYNEK